MLALETNACQSQRAHLTVSRAAPTIQTSSPQGRGCTPKFWYASSNRDLASTVFQGVSWWERKSTSSKAAANPSYRPTKQPPCSSCVGSIQDKSWKHLNVDQETALAGFLRPYHFIRVRHRYGMALHDVSVKIGSGVPELRFKRQARKSLFSCDCQAVKQAGITMARD